MFKFMLLGVLLVVTINAPLYAAEQTDKTAEQLHQKNSQENSQENSQKKDQDKDDGSLLNSIGKSIGNTIGLLTPGGRTEGEEGVPRRIAVLPAVGQGDERERDDIRTVIHNNLSSKNFELLKPYDIDRRLVQLEQSEGRKLADYDPVQLAEKLQVEGLIYVDVPLVEKVYAAAYAHYKITIKLSFYSKVDDNIIWEKEQSIAEREGGISLNPLSFIAQAISSAQVLTEAVRQTLVDKLARVFASEIPFPIGQRAKIQPVKISLAMSNVADGPFRAGDEITVVMRAEPGLAATFDIGNKFTGNALTEQGEGEYVGRYIVNDNDNANDLIIKVNAARIENPASIQWRVPGRVGIDTIAPQAIASVHSSPVKDAIKLSWSTGVLSNETLTYHVQRADPQTGLYAEVAAINISEYVDDEIVEGNTYHYRVYAEDDAKNRSPFATIEVAAVGTGPTNVSEDIIADSQFYAVASPYIIDKPITVLRNATLTLSPGTIIKFVGEGRLNVLGKINGLGEQQSPIQVSGDAWRMTFSNTGDSESQFSHSHFNQGSLLASQSALRLNHCTFREMSEAIKLSNGANLTLTDSKLLQNEIGLLVEDGKLLLDKVAFIGNDIGWKVIGRQGMIAANLSFEDNEIHISSSEEMVIKGAQFNDLDYEDFLEKIKGDVEVDWSGVTAKDNLQAIWLQERWLAIIASAKAGLWQESYQAVDLLKAYAPKNSRLNSFHQALKFMTGNKVTAADSFTLSMQRFTNRDQKGRLWIQEVKLPYVKSIENSDGYIKKQAAKKFVTSYLKQNYPHLKPTELRKYRRKVKIAKNIVDSQVVYVSKKGLFLHVWLANYLDSDKITSKLKIAGLIQRQNSELTIGLLSQTDVFEFEELIVKALKKHQINYISLGSGSYGKPAQAKAVKMGANIILETAVQVDESQSGISENLKMANVNLVLDLYDVQTNKTLDHLTASENAAGFKKRDIVNQAVTKAFARVESRLLTALWSADDIVAAHKKAQLKREKAAKAKAKKARIAREKAEKKRIAQAKAKAKAKQQAEEKAALAKKEALAKQAEAEKLALAQAKTQQDSVAIKEGVVDQQVEPVTSAEIKP